MTKSRISGKVLYVQLGRDETRIALFDGVDTPSLTLQTPAGAVGDGVIQNMDAVRAMLKSALQQPEFKGCRKVVFSLCTSQVITEVADNIPANVTGKNLEKLLQANADTYFPVVDMQEYKLVWQPIGPKGGDSKEQKVQLWAVPTSILTRYYQVANACDLLVERIDYCGYSVASAVGASFAQPAKAKERKKLSLNAEISFGKKKEAEAPAEEVEDKPQFQPDTQLHVFLDSDILGVTFVQNNQVKLQRFIRCGANPAHQFDELAMMMDYYSAMECGRGSAITGFVCGSLAENLEMVAELANTLGISMQAWEGKYEPKWILCVGAAAGSLEFGMPALNVMKAGRQVESQLWQYVLLLATGLVLGAAVLLLMTSRLGWESEKSALQTQQQTLLIELKKTSGYADQYEKFISEYNKYSADWDAIFENLHLPNDNLVFAMKELEAMLPKDTDVTNMQIAADGLTFQFSCSSKEEVAYLIMALRELEYLELVSISNMSGGGGGPATSYGPQQGDTEAPPTEGSYEDLSEAEIELLAGLLAANMDQAEVMKVFMGLSDGELTRLENVYGKKPVNKYSSLSMLLSAYATKDTFTQRSNALKEMLTTNPFAVQRFKDMVMEDVWAPEPILLWYIYDDLLLPENSDLMDMLMGEGSLSDPEKAYSMMERLLVMLTKDEETLAATEALICTDSKMERWYVYYVEMELGLQPKGALGYLNVDRLMQDLMEGSFNTGDRTLDKKLNKLIPKEVLDALEQIKNNGGNDKPGPGPDPDPDYKKGPEDYSKKDLMVMIYSYLETGSTKDAYVDGLIKQYLQTGSTGDDRWDTFLKQYEKYLKGENGGELPNPVDPDGKKPDDYDQAALLGMFYGYMNTGSTGDSYLDGLIDNFLLSGSTGDADWDAWLEPYKQLLLPEQSGGNGGVNGRYPYYITVSFKYTEALKEIVQEREGLNKDDKVQKPEGVN